MSGVILSQTEIGERVRKTVNLMLTKTMSSKKLLRNYDIVWCNAIVLLGQAV